MKSVCINCEHLVGKFGRYSCRKRMFYQWDEEGEYSRTLPFFIDSVERCFCDDFSAKEDK